MYQHVNMKKQIILILASVFIFLIYIMTFVSAPLEPIKLNSNYGIWKVIYSNDKDFMVYIADKTKRNTEICMLSLTAKSEKDLPSLNIYDSNKNVIVISSPISKNVDSKTSYGYCINTGNETYLKFGEHSTEIIYITKAYELDEERNYTRDIYDLVYKKDNTWASIENEHYVRVTFEKNLTRDKDITIYAKANESSEIEVYMENDDKLITTFKDINKEKWYNIYLTNLSEGESYDVFDLKIIGNISFDYIVDPIGWCYQDTANVSTECGGLDTGTYALVGTWTNGANTYDEDWATYGAGTSFTTLSYLYINYTKPAGANSSSYWVVRDGATGDPWYNDLTILSSCWNYNETKLILRVSSSTYKAPTGSNWTCYDGGWQQLRASATYPAFNIMEEAMYWDITDITAPTVNITYPTNGMNFNSNVSIPLNYSITDESLISTCWWTIDNGVTNNSIVNTSELVTNGGFDTDSNWGKGTNGWIIESSKASWSSARSVANLTQTLNIKSGRTYNVSFTILEWDNVNITVYLGGTAGTKHYANGVYSENIVSGSYNANITFSPVEVGGGFIEAVAIDNVIVKETGNCLNTTIDVPEGNVNLTLYVNDTYGNVGNANVSFNVNLNCWTYSNKFLSIPPSCGWTDFGAIINSLTF